MSRTAPIERRSRIRYPIALNVKYRTLGRYHRLSGRGTTVDFSSTGVLIGGAQQMAPGTRLEINIEWPTLLDGLIPLQVVAIGRVVRSLDAGFAVSFGQYQFRTMSRKLQSAPDDGWESSDAPLIRSAGA